MALLLTLYNYDGEPNRVDKTSKMASIREMNGTFQVPESVTDPVIEIYDDITTGSTRVLLANYMYIPILDRYYFITNIETVRTNVWRVYGHVDVLMSYKDDIDSLQAMAVKSENQWNAYLPDSSVVAYQYDDCDTLTWGTAETPTSFSYSNAYSILVTTG